MAGAPHPAATTPAGREESTMNRRRALAALGTAGAFMAGATLSAAPAQAAVTQYARLVILPAGGGYYDLFISGQSAKANAAYGIRLYGDDEWFDDYLANRVGYLQTGPDGYFGTQWRVPGSLLNEDWGRDEIYVKVGVSGGSTLTSNNVNGYF
jgi:hypothetical protein